MDEILCFIVAIGAPRSSNDGQHDLALELGIIIGDQLAIPVREFERKDFIGIAYGGVLYESSGAGRPLARGLRTIRSQLIVWRVRAFQLGVAAFHRVEESLQRRAGANRRND